ncbi:MAG: aminotransferase class IV [Pseudomonadota bacterium]
MAGPRWEFGPPLDLSDRGFQYGDGLFETIDFTPQGGWLADRHWSRLRRGATALSIALPASQRLDVMFEAIDARARQLERALVKLYLSAAGDQRGYGRVPDKAGVLRASVQGLAADDIGAPAKLWLAPERVAATALAGGHKHLNRLDQVLRSSRLDNGYDEVLVATDAEVVEEGCRSNVFFQYEGQFCTPPIVAGVCGVLRERLLQCDWMQLQERPVAVSDLAKVEAAWIGNSVFGLRPVVQIQVHDQNLELKLSPRNDALQAFISRSRSSERTPLTQVLRHG